MKSKILYIILLLFCAQKSLAQELLPPEVQLDTLQINESKNEISQIDSVFQSGYEIDNPVFPKKFQNNFKAKYKSEDFNYTTTKSTISIWEKLKNSINQFFRDLFGQPDQKKAFSYTKAILRFLGILLIGFVLYLIINFIFNKNGNFFFSKKNKNLEIKTNDFVENIHEINFSEIIAKLEQQKDFRSAIRYQFLSILKKFSDQKLINWNPEKTNQEYILEIKNTTQRQKFSELTYIYNYVWYGEFLINKADYETFKTKFITN